MALQVIYTFLNDNVDIGVPVNMTIIDSATLDTVFNEDLNDIRHTMVDPGAAPWLYANPELVHPLALAAARALFGIE